MIHKVIGMLLLLGIYLPQLYGQISNNIIKLGHWDDEEIPFNGSAKYNDVWGFSWNEEEYGVIGSTMGTHILHLPKNNHVRQVAFIPGRFQEFVVHRDFAFYDGFLYAVCDQGLSSLQVIDITYLPDSAEVVLDDNTFISTAHNVTVDSIGQKLYVSGPAGNAMTVFDLSETPENPEWLIDFNGVEYVHDVYVENNLAYLNAGNQGLFIYDFTNGAEPEIISFLDSYPEQGYNHSGWASPNGQYYAFADETLNTRMKIVDVSDITDLNVVALFDSELNLQEFYETQTAPHNLEWIDDKIYVSHYFDGLQVFDVSDPENPQPFAHYDTFIDSNTPWRGAWGVHVMESGRILISDRQTGFYLFQIGELVPDESDLVVYPIPNSGEFCIDVSDIEFKSLEIEMSDMDGKNVFELSVLNTPNTDSIVVIDLIGIRNGIYILKLETGTGKILYRRLMIE